MKKHRDRRVRSEVAREAKRAHLDSTSRRRNNELLALAERHVALERAREEDVTFNQSSTSSSVHQDIVPSTTPDLPHVFALMDEPPTEGSLNQHLMMSSSRWAWISTLSSHPCLSTSSAPPSLKLDFNLTTLKPNAVHSNSYLDVHFSSTLSKNRASENCDRWTI